MKTGTRIRNARKAAGLSQVRLAEMIGISKQSMYKYETGVVAKIPYDKIESISRIFHVSPAYLLGLAEEDGDSGTAIHKRLKDYFLALFEKLDDMDNKYLVSNAEVLIGQEKYGKYR